MSAAVILLSRNTSRKGLRNLRSGDQSVMANATLENAPKLVFERIAEVNGRALRIIAEGTAPMRTKVFDMI